MVLGNPAVPDPGGLISQVIEAVREGGIHQVCFCVKQERDFLRMLGVECEVPRLCFLDPRST